MSRKSRFRRGGGEAGEEGQDEDCLSGRCLGE